MPSFLYGVIAVLTPFLPLKLSNNEKAKSKKEAEMTTEGGKVMTVRGYISRELTLLAHPHNKPVNQLFSLPHG